MQLGFSYVGFIYLVMLTAPNLLWMKNQPKDYSQYIDHENKILLFLERVGEVFVSCISLIFADFNLRPWSSWSWWLVISFVLMICYELFWVRYFRGERTMADFYASFLGVPVAGATLPVAAFFALALYGRNPLLLFSVMLLGIGHIGIHLGHRRELK